MRRIWQGAIGTALLVLALSGAAGANMAFFSDPAGDVERGGGPDYDVIRAAHAHENGFLLHTVRTRGQHTDDSPAPELYIRVGTGRNPDFRVTAAGVFRIGTGAMRKVGNARLRAPTARAFELLFRPRAINNPRKYRWRVLMGAPGGPLDRAPAGYVTHALR